ncbi:RluA family pseudouridine synthase [Marinicella sediminis]|uniref:Pseudouridine synthase n=1 Tax=Marinicella sediminis TaxID=1792834 RepID=A0ABV7J7V8_9GAMM|nr:RluA family pseudouridine synthase [Marinicella sediminis]
MSKKPILVVTDNESGQRLDNYLLKHRKQVAKSNWYKLIRKGQVRINGKRAKPLSRLIPGDEVRIPPGVFFIEKKVTKVPDRLKQQLQACVVFENADFLVLDKPAGMPVHAGSGHDCGVVEALTAMKGFENLQLAHRLDKDTSGCLLLAKNRQALLAFQQAMKEQQVKKSYLALLTGEFNEAVTVEQPLNTHNRVNGIRTVVVDPSGQHAVTHFEPIQSGCGVSLVACRIETGRTHQIRVHAQHLGCPVLGDRLYGKADNRFERKLFLHACRLRFADQDFQAPEPSLFRQVFQQLNS